LSKDNRMPSFELATYLVASARDCLEEPLVYGPLRMLVGVDEIVNSMERGLEPRDEFLIKMRKRIWDNVITVMNDREAFAQALDSILAQFAEEFKSRVLSGEGSSG
jgi:uncharacterized protein DUF6092